MDKVDKVLVIMIVLVEMHQVDLILQYLVNILMLEEPLLKVEQVGVVDILVGLQTQDLVEVLLDMVGKVVLVVILVELVVVYLLLVVLQLLVHKVLEVVDTIQMFQLKLMVDMQ